MIHALSRGAPLAVSVARAQTVGERVGLTFMDGADGRWPEGEGGVHMAAPSSTTSRRRDSSLMGKVCSNFSTACTGRIV
jgi:hypothetical protein